MRQLRNGKRLLLPGIWIFALLLTAGCGREPGNKEPSSETKKEMTVISLAEESPADPEEDVRGDASGQTASDQKIVRIFLPNRGERRFQMDGAYLEQQFENAGYEAVLYDAASDPERQAAALRASMNLPTDLRILVPIDEKEVRRAVGEISESEIPLILYDQPLSNMSAAAFFVGFRDSDTDKALEEVRRIEAEALSAPEETEQEEDALDPDLTEDREEAIVQEEPADPEESDTTVPLLGADKEIDTELLRELSEGERQAVVYLDPSGEAVVALDLGINLLRGVTPDAGMIRACGWSFPCLFWRAENGNETDAFYLQPVILTKDNMEKKLVVPGYYVKDEDGYLRPAED